VAAGFVLLEERGFLEAVQQMVVGYDYPPRLANTITLRYISGREMKSNENTVLSFSHDPDLLLQREAALRSGGFEVISVRSESQACFEIEMGRCGVLLICYTASVGTIQDLTRLFRRRCPNGIIVFVTNRTEESVAKGFDHTVLDSAGPEAIVRVLSSGLYPQSKAS
jgi:hypothetical protein